MELNTREITKLIWLGFVAAAILLMPTMRTSLGVLWQAFTQKKLIQVMTVLALYVGPMIWFLYDRGGQ